MESTIKTTFPVTGLHCASCAINVETILKTQKGVKSASVNYANSTAHVEYIPDLISSDDLKTVVQSIGYDIIVSEKDGKYLREDIQQQYFKKLKFKTIWSLVLALPVFIMAMFFMEIPYVNWIMLVLTTPVVIWFGRSFFINAYNEAKHFQADMDTLVALSTGVAFLFSTFNTVYPEFWLRRSLNPHVFFEASCVVIAFIMFGKLLEERAKSNTSSSIKKLMGLQPKTVTVIYNFDMESVIPISKVKVGDKILVKPGDKIAVDGQIIYGYSYVDESTITGEAIPVGKKQGDLVFAGTINQKGSFQFIANKVGGETVLAHIINMVEEAQGSKPPVQKLVDKIAGIFVPVVLIISVLTFIVWMIFGGEDPLPHALLAMITVLVIACPCALGLATPTAIIVGIGKGAENGILIKDADSLELAHKVNTVVLDKTGTVTEGKPEVTDFIWNIPESERPHIKSVLLAIDSKSEHPLAESVYRVLKAEGIQPETIEDFESFSGKGVMAKSDNINYRSGNQRFMEEHKIEIPEGIMNQAEKLQREAKTVTWFAGDDRILGIIAITDKVKVTSSAAVQSLMNIGIEVYMLTGDNSNTAKAIAEKTGIVNYKAELMPSDKADFIKKLQKEGKLVAMVGDGINDSQALAQADVSIAMGKGSDIAMDVAKMTIISSDLQLIPKAIRLSRLTVRSIRQNLFWAFFYNVIGIPIAAGILYPIWGFMLNPMIAGASMALSSVSVVSNSLRLKTKSLDIAN